METEKYGFSHNNFISRVSLIISFNIQTHLRIDKSVDVDSPNLVNLKLVITIDIFIMKYSNVSFYGHFSYTYFTYQLQRRKKAIKT